jgi:glycosyltransferase involved in cell wall biosynthesis
MSASIATADPPLEWTRPRKTRPTLAVIAPDQASVPILAPAADVRFVLVSFEGPDRYSSAGGLAVRVSNLARSLASQGNPVDLYFVGDPDLPGVEERDGVTLHRWCQAISATAREGVYDAEERKIEDLCVWLPDHLARIVAVDRAAGRKTVVLAEDWHTVWPLIAVHDELVRRGLRDSAVMAWTANNRFGFDRIDFGRLASAAILLTISRAMKHLMWQYGVNPLVVPNGIPHELLDDQPLAGRQALRQVFAGRRVSLAKVGRWDPDKRWHMALDAVARLRDRGEHAVLLARGWNGSAAASAHHRELQAHADRAGLPWVTLHGIGDDPRDLAGGIRAIDPGGSAVIELAFPVEGPHLRALYGGVDAVLANSGFEPFGLVGLEAMASDALVVTGATGEDYLVPFHNGFALDTDDPCEIVRCLDWARRDPGRERALRTAARETAGRYRWADVTERLFIALGIADDR